MSEWRWNLNLNASLHGRHHVGIQALPAREPEPAMLSKALNKHRTGGSEAGQAAEICHRTRCSTASWVNTETGLFVFGHMSCKQRLMDSNAPLSGAVLGKTIEDGKLQLKSVCYREGHEFQMT